MKIRLLISGVIIGLAGSVMGHQVEAAPSMGLVLPGGWQAGAVALKRYSNGKHKIAILYLAA
ncbi:hypothetical protein [Vibrio variabilis]|uniref:hypothetical protein n=1 Tax=Vibrio variabilis TaxID=990271 RepID=UPI0013A6CC87|nr:hypothetical protein [Vibrio variabilis]